MFTDDGIPEHIVDDEILADINTITSDGESYHIRSVRYQPSVGLLIKLVKGLRRLKKREKITRKHGDVEIILFKLYNYYRQDSTTFDAHYWTPQQLMSTANNFLNECREISPTLLRTLDRHYLLPPLHDEDFLHLAPEFLVQVVEYHKSLQRPANTFEDVHEDEEYLQALAAIRRETCPQCGGQRQLYCGECGGIRMSGGLQALPPRVDLPFDILLILHWRDSLHKCTGIHAAVLCTEGTLTYARWRKDRPDEWREIVASLDSRYDLMVYPTCDAVPADEFDWTAEIETANSPVDVSSSAHATGEPSSTSESTQSGRPRRRRIVLLEGPWEGAKTLAKQLIDLRQDMGLPPLTYLTLQQGVTARYWRLQHVGSSAVSTIEAIAHIAWEAVYSCHPSSSRKPFLEISSHCDDEAIHAAHSCKHTLLTLFNLQRYRVFISVKAGARVPLAMALSNSGGFSSFWDGYFMRHIIDIS